MNPLFLFPIAFGLLGLKKPRRSSTPRPRGPRITILECEGWDIPAAWWAKVAQPYWDKSLDRLEASWSQRPGEPKAIPVEEIAKNLLIPELQRNPPHGRTVVERVTNKSAGELVLPPDRRRTE